MDVKAGPQPRTDALDKATGATRFSADVCVDGPSGDQSVLHAAIVRSPVPCARIRSIDAGAAVVCPGVVGVFTAEDLPAAFFGRRVRDIPMLAAEVVRFSGERVAVVLAASRRQAEAAAELVDVDYEELPAVFDADDALGPDAPSVHETAWSYEGAVVGADDHPNLQSEVLLGDPAAVDELLAASAHVVERRYHTPAGHQGYLEPHAWLAVPLPSGKVRLHCTTKAPYRLREQLAVGLGLAVDDLEVRPTPVGGDFGGKGAPGDAPVCVALARKTGRPVRLVLRSMDDLAATDARHPASIGIRVGCDSDGRLTALAIDAVLGGGAYAGAKPLASVNLHGVEEGALGYRLGGYSIRSRVAYTNTVPKGHMRAPGGLQTVFALESALDELAATAGISGAEIRRRNVLGDGDVDAYGHRWDEARGAVTLAAALEASTPLPVPPGWLPGCGLSLYARPTGVAPTSARMRRGDDGRVLVEVPVPETGTGSHTVVRQLVAERLGTDIDEVDVRQVATSELPYDLGVGASRVTVGLALAVEELAKRWETSGGDGPVSVDTDAAGRPPVLSYCAQVAHVAVDPATGQVEVLRLVSAVDVARIVNPVAHQLQIDGGAVMGYGAACMEDLLEEDGQVGAATLGDFKLPSSHDVPLLSTVLVGGGRGMGPSDVKSVGELTNVGVAAAVANAVADATGARMTSLPITAERVYWALHGSEPT